MRDRYTKNYEYRDVVDEDGKASSELVYVGEVYVCTLTETQKKLLCQRALGSSVCILLLLLLGGFFPSGAGRSYLVMLPYLASLASVGFLTAGAWMLRKVPEQMTEKQYEHSFARTARSSLLTGLFTILTVLADLIYLIRNGDSWMLPGEFVLFFTMLLAAVLDIRFFRQNKEALESVQE